MSYVRYFVFVHIIVVLFMMGNINKVLAQNDTLILRDGIESVDLYEYFTILSDNEAKYSVEDIVQGQYDDQFISPENYPKKRGFFKIGKWLKLDIGNEASHENWILEFAFPIIYDIHIYTEDEIGIKQEIVSGSNVPFTQRDYNEGHFAFNLPLKQGEQKTFYIFVTGGADLHPPINIVEKDLFIEKSNIRMLFHGLFYGTILVMIMYNLFLYISLRMRAYLYYVLSISFSLTAYMALNGDGFKYFWPNLPYWNSVSVATLVSIASMFILLFTREFLDTDRHIPSYKKTVYTLFVCNISTIFIVHINLFVALNIMFFTSFLTFTSVIIVGFMSLFRGVREARFFIIGWLVFLGGTFITILERATVLPYSVLTEYVGQGMMGLEVVLLSLALADKINMMRMEKELAQKQARESQEIALDSLRRTDMLKDDFLAMTSHELRTPLYGMIGIAESLRDGVAGHISSNMQNQLNMIVISGKRLSSLVNDMLDFSQLRHESITLQRKKFYIQDIIKIVFTVCEPLLKNKNVMLNHKMEEHIPPVYADPDRLQQILYNLVGNAIKYTDKGEVIVAVKVVNHQVVISIIDTGRGISEENLKVIFNPFQQGDKRARDTIAGAGIGLSVSKQLVELHGSKLSVTSKLNSGSTFSFALPIDNKADDPVIEIEHAMITETATEVILSKPKYTLLNEQKKILIVDDEVVNLQVLMNHLSLAGFEVMITTNSEDVENLIRIHTFDLIILDIMMPNKSGYEVCEDLRLVYSPLELPILMLTAKDRVQDKLIAFSAGANDYVTTPCDKEELLARVQSLVHLKSMNDELTLLNNELEEKVLERTEELEAANIDLQEMNESLIKMATSRRNLLTNIAHELGTPVMLLHSYVQALQAGLIDREDEKYQSSVEHHIKVLNRLIDDLADLSHLEEGQSSLSKQEKNVANWLERVYKKFVTDVYTLERKAVTDELDPLMKSYRIFVDVERLDQVFSNVLSNAVKNTDESGVITLTTSINMERQRLLLSIRDNGIGMIESQLPYIFERFYQQKPIDNTKERMGLGIGLAIVKEIIEGHGGKVWAESKVGEGSVFYIALPVGRI